MEKAKRKIELVVTLVVSGEEVEDYNTEDFAECLGGIQDEDIARELFAGSNMLFDIDEVTVAPFNIKCQCA